MHLAKGISITVDHFLFRLHLYPLLLSVISPLLPY